MEDEWREESKLHGLIGLGDYFWSLVLFLLKSFLSGSIHSIVFNAEQWNLNSYVQKCAMRF